MMSKLNSTLEEVIKELKKEEQRSRNATNYKKADRLDRIVHRVQFINSKLRSI